MSRKSKAKNRKAGKEMGIRMKALTPEEVRKVLKISSQSKRNHAMILLAFKHGMRASEVCDLKLSDLDLKNGEVTIRRKKGSLKTVQPLADLPGEPLLSEKRVLRAWLAERKDASDYVFTSQKGGRLDRTQFFRIFQDVAERAGLPADRVRATLCSWSKSVSRASSQSLFRTSSANRPAFRSAALLKKDCKRTRNSSGPLSTHLSNFGNWNGC